MRVRKGLKLFYFYAGTVIQLPLELIHSVVSFVDSPATLARLCLVSHIFRDVGAAQLYQAVKLHSPSTTVMCLKTLNRSPELARHVRTLSITYPPHTDMNTTKALSALLGRALHNTPMVTVLSVDLYTPFSKYLKGAPFRATTVQISCDWDADLTAWLLEQASIRVFVFNGLLTPNVPIPRSVLPGLTRVTGIPRAICAIVPGRPVEQVLVSCVQGDPLALHPSTFDALARSCEQSTRPIRALLLAFRFYRNPAPEEVFECLSALPDRLPGLVKLSILLQGPTHAIDEASFLIPKPDNKD